MDGSGVASCLVAEGCAILDKGAVVAPGARIGYDPEADRRMYHVSETGITVVPHAPLHPPKGFRRDGEPEHVEASGRLPRAMEAAA